VNRTSYLSENGLSPAFSIATRNYEHLEAAMELDDLPESSNVSDQRGMKTVGGIAAGGGGILLLILGLVFGIDTNKLGLHGGGGGGAGAGGDAKTKEFAEKILGTLEKVWEKEFDDPKNHYGRRYEFAKLVLFSDGTQTGGCGFAPSSVGPFYCPGDKTIYLDPTFFTELEQQLHGSRAAFSQAYVIAHENGHHVQNLLGFNKLVDEKRKTRLANEYSVRLELQADYLAGVWANHGQKEFHFLQPGDVDEALKTALAIGDDRIMKTMGRKVWPESFSHGTAEQRAKSFSAGFRTGDATKAKLEKFFSVAYDPHAGELDDSLFR
jgi:predicted metalloprotease